MRESDVVEIAALMDCPVCGHQAAPYDCCDFNKNCEEPKGKFVPLSLKAIYYYRCAACGFLHAPEIRAWPPQKFKDLIYNDEYEQFDPDFTQKRPANYAVAMTRMFGALRDRLKLLDYGGGTGVMAGLLAQIGFDAQTYDPFFEQRTRTFPCRFDIVTAFEVFEHVPDPHATVSEIASLLSPEGLLLFSTITSDGNIAENGRLTWWYASPRNGHISLYSRKSLDVIAEKHGYKLHSFTDNFHMFYRDLPDWAAQAFNALAQNQ